MSARTRLGLAAAGLMLALLPAGAGAQVRLPVKNVPVPTPRPAIDAPVPTARPDSDAPDSAFQALGYAPRTALPDALERFADQAGERTRGNLKALRIGLDALSAGKVAEAMRVRDTLPNGSLDREILDWAVALDGGAGSKEILAVRRELAGWPGMAALGRNLERALYREKAEPGAVIAALGGSHPQTLEGVIALARAQLAAGRRETAQTLVATYWREAKLDAGQEKRFLREFASLLSQADHRHRMERMLYAERVNAAMRVAERAGAKKLAQAWGAVVRGDRKAGKLLEAVPKAQHGAGYAFAKGKYLRGRGKFAEAAKVVLAAPREVAALVDRDAWWIERRVLSRELLDKGDAKTAYEIAAGHAAESPARAADAEFHAGWYALRSLEDPAKAALHFQRIAEIAEGPISLARAYYWLGRAAEAGGPGEAEAYYEKAAQHGTAFYGQLAAARLGRSELSADYPEPTAHDRSNFGQRQPVQAIRRLEAAGHAKLADILYRDLAGELTSPGELAMLAAMAERRGDHHLALRIGKIAAQRGLDIGALSHPVGAIPAEAKISSVGTALAYAIARQESEFNVGAVSSAGARGLLQLLPGTAKAMARHVGLGYSRSRLTTDAAYNAALGSAYLAEQLGRFDGSYIRTFAGYNAGPGRAVEWVKRYGDPRGKDIETIVDWIERIPYHETRNYVQRVMENLEVYKMQLTGRFDIVADLTKGG